MPPIQEKEFQGKPAAPGYALAKPVFFVTDTASTAAAEHAFRLKPLENISVEMEIESYRQAASTVVTHFASKKGMAGASGDELTAQLMDAYCELVADEELEKDIVTKIQESQQTACEATRLVFGELFAAMASIEDEYARQRADDLRAVRDRLLRVLAGLPVEKVPDFPEGGGILFGDDLSPADTALIPKERLLGIVSRTGGATSHVAILARNLEIPAIVGAEFELTPDAESVFIDGFSGRIVFQPGAELCRECETNTSALRQQKRLLEKFRDQPAVTKSGQKIALLANIGHDSEVDLAKKFGADGIGLFRTEFLFMDSDHAPSEDEQFRAYKHVLQAMNDKPVTIRTFDVGGDKPLSYLPLPQEANPFLGMRGCRLYSAFSEVILTQLRALYRASPFGRLRIMFPMVVHVSEVVDFLTQSEEAKAQLAAKRIPFDESVQRGMMIETPAAALIADELLAMVDFASLGTNDLTQYTLAVDRGNEHIASLYDARHPAVVNLIKTAAEAGRRLEKPIGICGELASDEMMIPILLECGLNSLSMVPARIPDAKRRIAEL